MGAGVAHRAGGVKPRQGEFPAPSARDLMLRPKFKAGDLASYRSWLDLSRPGFVPYMLDED
ncbi:hypothetical protein [Methylobacterium oryzihabitans]|uniref:Uncharacterized protein n=1 Tax=Methylobacterium oryzihabitans TaxID=2499852 RepID=A0A437P1J2_9HYPH|nr:hypothetical protein [Methylobacterium oryzihabitans]RVU16123.1 hypothetical protein EOE48_17355 [Methylobacterium oryzihabitans]